MEFGAAARGAARYALASLYCRYLHSGPHDPSRPVARWMWLLLSSHAQFARLLKISRRFHCCRLYIRFHIWLLGKAVTGSAARCPAASPAACRRLLHTANSCFSMHHLYYLEHIISCSKPTGWLRQPGNKPGWAALLPQLFRAHSCLLPLPRHRRRLAEQRHRRMLGAAAKGCGVKSFMTVCYTKNGHCGTLITSYPSAACCWRTTPSRQRGAVTTSTTSTCIPGLYPPPRWAPLQPEACPF